jgi:hypothetical protein
MRVISGSNYQMENKMKQNEVNQKESVSTYLKNVKNEDTNMNENEVTKKKEHELFCVGIDLFQDNEEQLWPLIRIYDYETDDCLFTFQQAPVADRGYAEKFLNAIDPINNISCPTSLIIYEDGRPNEEFEFELYE